MTYTIRIKGTTIRFTSNMGLIWERISDQPFALLVKTLGLFGRRGYDVAYNCHGWECFTWYTK